MLLRVTTGPLKLVAVRILIALAAEAVQKPLMTLQIFRRMNKGPMMMGSFKRMNKSPIMMGSINKNMTEKPSCMMILTDKNPQSMKIKKTLTIATLNTNKKP